MRDFCSFHKMISVTIHDLIMFIIYPINLVISCCLGIVIEYANLAEHDQISNSM